MFSGTMVKKKKNLIVTDKKCFNKWITLTQLLKPDFQLPLPLKTQWGRECNNITLLQFNGLKQVISSNDSSFMMFIFFSYVHFVSEWVKTTKLLFEESIERRSSTILQRTNSKN